MSVNFDSIKGFAFDMDGVLADTARFHTAAWRQIADQVQTPWTSELEEELKGIDRMGSLDIILAKSVQYDQIDIVTRVALAEQKNEHYRQLISTLTPQDVLPGINEFLQELSQNGYKMVVASASKNAPIILERLNISKHFMGIVNPASLRRGKPDPAIFIAAAKLMNLKPQEVIGIEDSVAGLQSIHAAGQTSVGIGDTTVLTMADISVGHTNDLSLRRIKEHYNGM